MGLRYVFINNLGSGIGTMVGPGVTGNYVEENPVSFSYAVCLLSFKNFPSKIFC